MEAELNFLKNNNEILQKQINGYKEQNEKLIKNNEDDIKVLNEEISKYKCDLAMISFEKDSQIIQWKKYVKKLQTKLMAMGVKFKDKK